MFCVVFVVRVFGADEFEKLGKQQTAGSAALNKQNAKPARFDLTVWITDNKEEIK